MANRYESLAEFWPHYLAEHRVPGDRALHFLGTTWLFGCVALAIAQSPQTVIPALTAMIAVGWYASVRVEPHRPAFLEMLILLALALWGHASLLPLGIVGGYAMAWVGHFGIEKNKPAAFRYPVWSFISDFRVWGRMATGRMWTGDSLETPALPAVASR